jgi:hypothetical protein
MEQTAREDGIAAGRGILLSGEYNGVIIKKADKAY